MSRAKDCSAIENDLALFVGGDLDRRASLEIGEHLEGCRACADAVRRLADSRRALRDGLELGSGAVPDLWPGVRARLVETGALQPVPGGPLLENPVANAPAARNAWRLRRWMPLSAAAAALLALGLYIAAPPSETGVEPRASTDKVAVGGSPIQAQPVGLRRLQPGESALSNSATSIDALQEELRLRSTLVPAGGAQAVSQHRGLH